MKPKVISSPATIKKVWLNSPIDILIRIAETFSVSADYLLGLNDKLTLDVRGLSSEEVLHIQALVNDLRNK